MAGQWTDKKVFGEVGKIRVCLSETPEGEVVFNIRRWFEDESGAMRPTTKGVVVPYERWPEFQAVVAEATFVEDS